MSIKDKYNKQPKEAPKSRGNRDVMSKLFHENANTGIQGSVFTSERKIKKATFELDADLHRELKLVAVKEGKTMLQIVEAALKGYLNNC